MTIDSAKDTFWGTRRPFAGSMTSTLCVSPGNTELGHWRFGTRRCIPSKTCLVVFGSESHRLSTIDMSSSCWPRGVVDVGSYGSEPSWTQPIQRPEVQHENPWGLVPPRKARAAVRCSSVGGEPTGRPQAFGQDFGVWDFLRTLRTCH